LQANPPIQASFSIKKEGDYKEKLAIASQLSKQEIKARFPENSKDFRRYIANHREIPTDILDNKTDTSLLHDGKHISEKTSQVGNEKEATESVPKERSLEDHLQEKAINIRSVPDES
jgi:hypothetical protein